jgi:enterochelin esterase-like enzyme
VGADRAGGAGDPARAERAVGRLIVQVGSEEGDMVAGSLRLARLLAGSAADGAAGRLLDLEIVRGGHDYAWWRHGLSRGLDLVEQIDAASPSGV